MRVGIHGSCVTRDAFGGPLPEALIAAYVARSVIPSALGPAPEKGLPLVWLEEASPWERRMVEHDVSKTGLALLADAGLDMLIIDLIDERFDLIVGDGMVSDSASLRKSSAASLFLSNGEAFNLLSQRRDLYWQAALPKLLDWLRIADIPVVIHEARFAYRYRDSHAGEICPMPQSEAFLAQVNARLDQMYGDLVDGLGSMARRLTPPEALVVADDSHRWGLAPFHYIPAYYEWFAQALGPLLTAEHGQ